VTVVVVAIGAVVLALGARLYFAGHRAPTGQPPLVELTSDSLDSLKDDFNRSSDGIRIILLLSPT
jgi:hypothetical protein